MTTRRTIAQVGKPVEAEAACTRLAAELAIAVAELAAAPAALDTVVAAVRVAAAPRPARSPEAPRVFDNSAGRAPEIALLWPANNEATDAASDQFAGAC